MNNIIEDNYELFTNSGSGSGGYAHHIFCYAARELFNINIDNVEFKPLRYNLLSFPTNYKDNYLRLTLFNVNNCLENCMYLIEMLI